MVFLVSATLENATSDTARTIRTGAVQTGAAANNTAAKVRDTICGKLGWLQSQCSTNLSVDVRTYTQFNNPNAPSPVTNGAFDSTKLTYDPGEQGDIVLVRAFYRWTLLTPFLKNSLSNLNNGVTMITATSMFKNEPY
jgi:Flp pilus assembly protein TadG